MTKAEKAEMSKLRHIVKGQMQIINSERSDNASLRRYIHDYKLRHDKAVDALASLASGRGRKCDGDQNWEEAMKRLARQELAEIAKMPLREGA